MVLNGTRIHLIEPKELADYVYYINSGEFPLIVNGEAFALGIDNLANNCTRLEDGNSLRPGVIFCLTCPGIISFRIRTA